MEITNISFEIDSSDYDCPLGIKIKLDNDVLIDMPHLRDKLVFSHDLNDDDGEHKLFIEMSGKTSDHTTVDNKGNILKDSVLMLSNVVIDGIDVNQLFLEKCVYTHNFNGTQSEINDTFHGVAGCNGTITFEFTTPIYLWLLENM